jgi:hypothetical protein
MENVQTVTKQDLITETENAVIGLSLKIEKSFCIFNDLINDIFSVRMENKEDLALFKFKFDDYSTKAFIVEDYILEASKEVEKVEKLFAELIYQKRGTETNAFSEGVKTASIIFKNRGEQE